MKQVIFAFIALILVVVFGLVATNAAVKKTDVSLLGVSSDLSLLSNGIKWDPDGHITYVTFPSGKRRFFISGNQRTYTIDASTPITLQKALSTKPVIKENFGPDKSVSYRNFYATINSVVQTDPKNQKHLMGFAQYEEQAIKPDGTNDYANFTASVGLLESYDGGDTWKDFGPVIRGDDYLAPGTKISGAGEPSAIINNGYVYVYFVDWASGVKVSHADEIYLARTKIFADGGLGVIEYYKNDGFSQGADNMVSVIKVPSIDGANYASLPSVSYNKYLNQYLAIFETNIGFSQTVSSDGINWTNQKIFLAFNKQMSQRTDGDVWNSYPTLLSDSESSNDSQTGASGILYFATGIWPNTAHQLTAKAFQFK